MSEQNIDFIDIYQVVEDTLFPPKLSLPWEHNPFVELINWC